MEPIELSFVPNPMSVEFDYIANCANIVDKVTFNTISLKKTEKEEEKKE